MQVVIIYTIEHTFAMPEVIAVACDKDTALQFIADREKVDLSTLRVNDDGEVIGFWYQLGFFTVIE